MGEYADMAIDYMLSMDEYELNYPDELEGEDAGVFRRPRYQKQPKTCKGCGKTGLYWYKDYEEIGSPWRLHDYSLEEDRFVVHSCKSLNNGKFKSL